MGLVVDAIEVRRESYTPGYANSVGAALEPFPATRINEVLAVNQTGVTDNAGDRDPWIELVNAGTIPAALGGWYLSDSYANLTRWAFPAGAGLAAGEFRLVWADAETAETTPAAWHAGFRLTSPAGVVVLSRLQNGQPAVVDFLEYVGLIADKSYGYPAPRLEDSLPGPLASPTPAAPNESAPATAPRLLGLQFDPSGEATLRWSATPGRTYRLEAQASLGSLTWRHVGEVTATGIDASLRDAGNLGAKQQFYRVRLLP
jgi:hypothetical protein